MYFDDIEGDMLPTTLPDPPIPTTTSCLLGFCLFAFASTMPPVCMPIYLWVCAHPLKCGWPTKKTGMLSPIDEPLSTASL